MRSEPNRPARRSAKGQAMAIFALVSVLLFVVAGLAVAYALTVRMRKQR